MKVDFVSSRVCLGGLPGPLVPGFLGELVTCCGGRRERCFVLKHASPLIGELIWSNV